jgi:hypothetical protein
MLVACDFSYDHRIIQTVNIGLLHRATHIWQRTCANSR